MILNNGIENHANGIGGVSIYCFLNVNTGGHFFTANQAEADQAVAILGNVFTYEGVGFYA